MELETVASIRGKNKVVLNGYVYVKQKNLANDLISFECERRRGSGTTLSECKAKVKLNADLSVVSYLHEHTHAADSGHVEVLKVRASIKRKAEETDETSQQILGHELQQLSQQAAAQMIPIRHVRRNIRQVKQMKNADLPIPTNCNFEIPEEYKRLLDGENFLLYDSGCYDVNRFLIFGTERTLTLLNDSEHWFMDGTFKIVPALFFQLYTIQVLAFGSILPCMYILLPNKTQITYRRLFEEIKVLQPQVHPLTITIDFEKAAINAASECFPNVEIHGCFFHLAQNIFRKVRAVGLQERYKNDEDLSLAIRMIPALAFVPLDKVTDAFESLQETLSKEISTIVEYFEACGMCIPVSVITCHERTTQLKDGIEKCKPPCLATILISGASYASLGENRA